MLFNLYLNEIAFIFLPNGSNLYANDLVLISHSAKGLEKALSILSEYCDKWLLSVNPKKTRVMSYQKKKKIRKSVLRKLCFRVNKHNIEIVDP